MQTYECEHRCLLGIQMRVTFSLNSNRQMVCLFGNGLFKRQKKGLRTRHAMQAFMCVM